MVFQRRIVSIGRLCCACKKAALACCIFAYPVVRVHPAHIMGEQKVGGVVSIVSFFFVLYSAAEGINRAITSSFFVRSPISFLYFFSTHAFIAVVHAALQNRNWKSLGY